MNEDIDLVEHLAVLELKPGDVLVITHPDYLTADQAKQLQEEVKAALPDHEAIVLTGGLEMGAVRTSTAEADKPHG
jgi:G3E family GTPase